MARNILLLCSLLISLRLAAQGNDDDAYAHRLEGAPGERRLNDTCGVMLSYANDVFARTDRYFTQGVQLTVFHPAFSRLDPLYVLSPVPTRRVSYYATGVHESWTPSSIRSDSVLRGDRPYAAIAALRLECFSYNRFSDRARINSAVTLGVIGPPALGREIQTAIHRATGDFVPLGWQHQIRTDVLLNYRLDYQYILCTGRMLALRGLGIADVGTLQCKLGAGMRGTFAPTYATSSRFQLSLAAEVNGPAVGFDARLQGGVFNRSSPYILKSGEISRLVGYARLHAQFQYVRSGFGAEYTWSTREFKAGLAHAWGRLYVYHCLR